MNSAGGGLVTAVEGPATAVDGTGSFGGEIEVSSDDGDGREGGAGAVDGEGSEGAGEGGALGGGGETGELLGSRATSRLVSWEGERLLGLKTGAVGEGGGTSAATGGLGGTMADGTGGGGVGAAGGVTSGIGAGPGEDPAVAHRSESGLKQPER